MAMTTNLTLSELLRTSGIDLIDARALMRMLLGVNDAYLIAHGSDVLAPNEQACYRALVARRVAGEPIAYILGEREFYSRTFKVTPAVLIPRPETELLVDLALECLSRDRESSVLDLGTGSGCIAISIALECRTAHVVAVDQSREALQLARLNARCLVTNNVECRESNWFHAVGDQRFNVMVSNPPYVAAGDAHLQQGDLRFEPQTALVAGIDGLDCIRVIVAGARAHLVPGGWLLFEHGYNQASRCRALLTDAGFAEVQSWRDLAGFERVSGGCNRDG